MDDFFIINVALIALVGFGFRLGYLFAKHIVGNEEYHRGYLDALTAIDEQLGDPKDTSGEFACHFQEEN
jgi:hypothetical protein